MLVIGIAGGVGSGKSSVARHLASLGAVSLDADQIGHEVLGEMDVKEQLVERCLLYTSPSPRDISGSRMPSSA